MGNLVSVGLTGDGSALIDSGTFHEIIEIDAAVTDLGFYGHFESTIQPRRTYQIGWIGLSVSAPLPGTTTPLFQWMTAVMFVDAEYRIFTEPAPNAVNFPWGADTLLWGFRDSVVTVNVWW